MLRALLVVVSTSSSSSIIGLRPLPLQKIARCFCGCSTVSPTVSYGCWNEKIYKFDIDKR